VCPGSGGIHLPRLLTPPPRGKVEFRRPLRCLSTPGPGDTLRHYGGRASSSSGDVPALGCWVPAIQSAASVVRPSVVPAVRIVVAISVVTVGLSVAACGHRDGPRVSGTGSTTTTASTTAAEVATTLPPQAGYRGVESFCASAPLTGHVLYDGAAKHLVPSVLTVAIGGLPPDHGIYVDWSNDHIRRLHHRLVFDRLSGNADPILGEHGPSR
jgi:hypothetical protein